MQCCKHSNFLEELQSVGFSSALDIFVFGLLIVAGNLQEQYVDEQSESKDGGPLIMNAFEMIALSQGLNLSSLFDRQQVEFCFPSGYFLS